MNRNPILFIMATIGLHRRPPCGRHLRRSYMDHITKARDADRDKSVQHSEKIFGRLKCPLGPPDRQLSIVPYTR